MEDAKRKVRSDDVLCNLPSDKKALIILWLCQYSYRDTLIKIEAAPPEGFGIKSNYTSLRRFYARYLSPPKTIIEINDGIKASFESLLKYCTAHPELLSLMNTATAPCKCQQMSPSSPRLSTIKHP